MRTTFLAAALAVLVAGCTSTSKIQPAPPTVHDPKTPVAMTKPSIAQRIKAQRIQDAQVAQSKITVEGPVMK